MGPGPDMQRSFLADNLRNLLRNLRDEGLSAIPGRLAEIAGRKFARGFEEVAYRTPLGDTIGRGYRGHGVETPRVLISGMRRGLTPALAKLLRRRSAIEPEIGHMKTDGRLARCCLKGIIGDAIFAVLCGCGHNIRKILAHLRTWLVLVIATILNAMTRPDRPPQALMAA